MVHYYLERKLGLRSVTAGGPLNDSMFFINRTTLNEQEFRLTFHKDLEFLEVLGTELYVFTQDPQWKEVIVPSITNLGEYNSFRAQNNTVKIAHSEAQTIGQHKMEETRLEAIPYTYTYIDAPKRFTARVPVLGWPLEWIAKLVDRVIEIAPKYDERKAEVMSDQEREADSFANTYSLKIRFLEMKFKFAYVSLKDVAADLGGAQGAAGGATKGLGTVFALLFVADLVRMLRAKRSHDFTSFKCRQLQKRLPLYRATVEVLL